MKKTKKYSLLYDIEPGSYYTNSIILAYVDSKLIGVKCKWFE